MSYHTFIDGDIYYASDANLNVRGSTTLGKMFQAGTGATDGSGNLTVTFPTAFTGTPVVVGTAQSSDVTVAITSISITQVVFHASTVSAGGSTGAGTSHNHSSGTLYTGHEDSSELVVENFSLSYGSDCATGKCISGYSKVQTDVADYHHHHNVDSGSTGSENSHTHTQSVSYTNAGSVTINWMAYGTGV